MTVLAAAVVGAVVLSLVPSANPALEWSGRRDPSAPLPVFRIDIVEKDIVRGRKTPGTLAILEPGTDPERPAPVSLTSRIGIEVRGASSVILPKRSYDLELRDEQGDDRALSVLDLPAHSDWVLHGCGRDDTCLRNALAYALARDLGQYAPRTRFLELYLGDEYRGLYLLVERIRRATHRVDLPRPVAGANGGDITGGYIFRLELGEGSPADAVPRDWVSPVSSLVYSYHYPRFDDITAAQKDYLHGHVAAFERLMLSEAWSDRDTGYRAWIDVPSWVDFALIQELSHNIDAYHRSHYFQKWPHARGNKLAAGPVWDFDNGFGSTTVREAHRPDIWAHHMNRFAGGEPVPYDPPGHVPYVSAYWERLWRDSAFQRDLRCRWDASRAGPLHLDAITGHIDRWAAELTAARARNDFRWGIVEPYGDRVHRLKTWIAARVAWMDRHLPGTCRQG